jgi:hypothetical protein
MAAIARARRCVPSRCAAGQQPGTTTELTIPTIGRLFLLRVIAAFGLGRAVLVIPGRLDVGYFGPGTFEQFPVIDGD